MRARAKRKSFVRLRVAFIIARECTFFSLFLFLSLSRARVACLLERVDGWSTPPVLVCTSWPHVCVCVSTRIVVNSQTGQYGRWSLVVVVVPPLNEKS